MGRLIRNNIDYTGGGSILYQADGSTLLAYSNILDSKEAIEDNVADYNLVGANGLKEVLDGLSTGVELTRDEYDDLPASKLTDGIDYYITDEDGYEDMIDDSVTSDSTTWSSEKIDGELAKFNMIRKEFTRTLSGYYTVVSASDLGVNNLNDYMWTIKTPNWNTYGTIQSGQSGGLYVRIYGYSGTTNATVSLINTETTFTIEGIKIR